VAEELLAATHKLQEVMADPILAAVVVAEVITMPITEVEKGGLVLLLFAIVYSLNINKNKKLWHTSQN
jgi:hypothetical protein